MFGNGKNGIVFTDECIVVRQAGYSLKEVIKYSEIKKIRLSERNQIYIESAGRKYDPDVVVALQLLQVEDDGVKLIFEMLNQIINFIR